MKNILLVGGTKDAREIIERLVEVSINIFVTVATNYGKELIENQKDIKIFVGKLDKNQMIEFIKEHNIDVIIDASHPYATEVSKNMFNASKKMQKQYLRFERENISFDEYEKVLVFSDFESAAKGLEEIDGNILLTVGSNKVDIFTKEINNYKDRLFVRILPDVYAIKKCIDIGIGPGNIIALKGPHSKELNIELLKHVNAKILVTKDSGEKGGMIEKVQAAKSLGIYLVVIKRPEIDLGQCVRSIEPVLEFLKN